MMIKNSIDALLITKASILWDMAMRLITQPIKDAMA
jgi:hypothetical protein